MTRPFRDPIIYPGEPAVSAPSPWKTLLGSQVCVTGGELIPRHRLARWTSDGWECHRHSGAHDPDGAAVAGGPDGREAA